MYFFKDERHANHAVRFFHVLCDVFDAFADGERLSLIECRPVNASVFKGVVRRKDGKNYPVLAKALAL